ncbi:MAG: nitroreductase family protein [Alphaproteobacteria bacterium]
METDLFDIIHTTRAMRRLKPDPVPKQMIEKILAAGHCAPTGGNAQHWGFLVVEDKDVMRQVQALYRLSWDTLAGPHYQSQMDAMEPGEARDKLQRQTDAAFYLTEHFHEAPHWIVACLRVGKGGGGPFDGASIYPAVQNMLLAARALGVGATLTTRHTVHSEEMDAIFELPKGVRSFAILPIGYPLGNFGPVRRKPLAETVFKDRWGEAYF